MTIEELKVIITAQTAGLNREVSAARRQISGMQQQAVQAQGKVSSAFAGMKKAAIAAGVALAVKKIATELTDLSVEAIKIESQIDNLTRTMGASKAGFMGWAQDTASAFGISEAAAVKYGNAYSNLISGFISDTAASTAYTKQLIEASAVIASRTGRTVEDVNERIRSGLLGSTEAIEDLGINVNVALLETTDAFKQLANGRSWEKLTFQEQQQVRLFAIMEQSAKKFGSELAGGGASSLLKFNAELANLKLELGRAFAPLTETVLPALTDFISKLADGVKWISAFFAALRGETQAAGENLGQAAAGAETTAAGLDSANKSAKALNKTLAGFDELHVIDQGSGSESAASAASGIPATGGAALEPVQAIDTSAAEAAASRIQEAFEKAFSGIQKVFAPSISAWGKAFEKLKAPASKAFASVKKSATDCWNNTLAPMAGYITGEYIPTITNSFSETFAPIFGEVMPVLFDEFSKDFTFACQEFDRVSQDILKPALERTEIIAVDVFGGIKTAWDEHGTGILEKFQEFKESLRTIWDTLYSNVFKPVFDRIGGTVSWLWDNHLKPLWENITNFVGSVWEFLLALWNTVLAPMVNFVVTVIGPNISAVVGSIGDIIGTVVAIISDVIGGILKSLGGLLDFLTGVFTGDWEKAWNGIKDFFGGIWDAIWGIVKGAVNLIIDGLNLLWGGVYTCVSGIVNGIGGIAGAIGDLFGQDWHFDMPAEPPLIPKLASGGLAYGPTLAMIGEGNDREAVLPLNQGVYAEIAKGINSQGNPAVVLLLEKILEAVQQINPDIVMDGRSLATASAGYYEAEQRRAGPSVVRVV